MAVLNRLNVHIGTSGFGVGQAEYFQKFTCIEVQHTFYQPPRISTLERWRAQAPAGFEFVLKAWQLITHDAKSPTYRRLKIELAEKEKQEAGYFKSTPTVMRAWADTLACARALNARTILFQCPASFTETRDNISNLTKFFQSIERCNAEGMPYNFCWEPRGDWNPKRVRDICEQLDLWHAVDPFTTRSVTPDRLYFRLHGKTGWRYEYDETELRELALLLPNVSAQRTPYVFFNNVRMVADALRFQKLLSESVESPD